MSNLEKKNVSEAELRGMIRMISGSQFKFRDIEWEIINKGDLARGENFDVKLTVIPPNSSFAVGEFLDQVSKIKGEYWLVS